MQLNFCHAKSCHCSEINGWKRYNDYDDNRDVSEIPVSGRHKIVENWVYCRAENSMSGGELSMCHVSLFNDK